MGLYLDSANIKEVKKALSWNFLSGVTTNPSIIAREGVKPVTQLQKICRIKPGKVFAQVDFDSLRKMEAQALKLYAVYPEKTVIKIPFSEEGIRLVPILKEKEIETCLTAIFSVSQGFIGAEAGADYLAVYVGRVTRNGGDGLAVVKTISEIIKTNDFNTRILAASIPSVDIAENLLSIERVDVTAPMKILEEMMKHELTDKAIEQFKKCR